MSLQYISRKSRLGSVLERKKLVARRQIVHVLAERTKKVKQAFVLPTICQATYACVCLQKL
jgi:hypothetical protein